MGAQRWIPIGPFNLQPSEFGRVDRGADAGDVLRREPPRRAQHRRPGHRRRLHRRAAAAHRQAAGPRHGRHADARSSSASRTSPACGCGCSASIALAAVLLAPVAWKFALKDYQKSRITTFLDPGPGSARGGLPADPGPRSRSAPAASRARGSEGHAGAVQVPAGRPQRFHLLGARRGAGVRRRARRRSGSICS